MLELRAMVAMDTPRAVFSKLANVRAMPDPLYLLV